MSSYDPLMGNTRPIRNVSGTTKLTQRRPSFRRAQPPLTDPLSKRDVNDGAKADGRGESRGSKRDAASQYDDSWCAQAETLLTLRLPPENRHGLTPRRFNASLLSWRFGSFASARLNAHFPDDASPDCRALG